ncbi:uncharacterized protein GJ701_007145 [Geothlypis trichas]
MHTAGRRGDLGRKKKPASHRAPRTGEGRARCSIREPRVSRRGSGWWRQSRSPDLPVGRSACGCKGSAPQAAPVQSLAAENLLCSFPAEAPAQPSQGERCPQLPAAPRSSPHGQGGQRSRRGGQGRVVAKGAGGREKGRPVSASHLPGRLAGVPCSPLFCISEEGSGEGRGQACGGFGEGRSRAAV